MNFARQRIQVAGLLVGLPLFSNLVSFVIFAPLFSPNRTVTNAEFQRAGINASIAIWFIELIALVLIVGFLRQGNMSLKDIVNLRRDRLGVYFFTLMIALPPTLAAGWLYTQAQAQAGIEIHWSQLSWQEIGWWYIVTPISAAFLEETIWRGYAMSQVRGAWSSLLFTSLSFALFHGIFNPLVIVATFIQGWVWGWACRNANSTVPSMTLHFLSRYLALVPGFG